VAEDVPDGQGSADGATHLPVLLYHRVGSADPDPRSAPLTVTTAKFARQIRRLERRGYVGIRPSDWVAFRRHGRPLPRKPILITFDDAYAEVGEHALPILHEHGFTATIFVVTGQLGGYNSWDDASGLPQRILMSAQDIRRWAAIGFEFGGHSHGHIELTKLTPAELDDELTACRDVLTELLGHCPCSFAYPYGSHNHAVRAATARLFEVAFGTTEGRNDTGSDLFDVHRTYVFPNDLMIDFASRTRLGYSILRRLQGRVRLRSRLARFLRRGVTGVLLSS
jgi:peptidoglycan/xylan/chitin deacetylase (PgdA/CDA1 family)